MKNYLTRSIVLIIVLSALLPQVTKAEIAFDTIVVTAQKRAQNINEVPLTIKTFGPEQITDLGITQPSDLAKFTPGVTIKPTVGDQNPVITIRGVGFNDFTPIQNPGTGVYVDQVIVPFHPMMSFQLLDLEQVEVIKGPQGTLYGRNSTAGAINFVAAKPQQAFSAKTRLDYSRWDTTELEVAMGGGLSPNLSTRIAFNQYRRNGSYQQNRTHPDDDIGEQDRSAYRLSLLWENDNDNFDALLNIHGGRDDSAQVALEHLASLDAITFAEPCAPVAAGTRAEGACINAFGYFDPDNNPHAGDYSVTHGGVDNDAFGAALTLNWQLNNRLTLISVTGYDEFERNQLQDIDASPRVLQDVTFNDDTEAFSQEIRLAANRDGLNWLAGVFYSDDSVDARQSVDVTELFGGDLQTNRLTAEILNDQDSRSLAIFVNGSLSLSSTLDLLAGLRYTDEQKRWHGGTLAPVIGVDNFATLKIDDQDLSGQLGLEYRPDPHRLVYGKFSKGFRSGGFPGGFSTSPEQLRPFAAEQVYAWEGGFKATLLDGTMQFNTAAYYYDWRNLQTLFTQAREELIGVFLTNAGDADIKGVEIQLDWAVNKRLTLHGGLNLMSHKISSADIRLDNKTLANAPKLSYNLMAEYTLPLGSYVVDFIVDAGYNGKRFFTTDNEPAFHGKAYTLVNARINLTPASTGSGNWDDWKIGLWLRNLTDESYRSEGFNQFGLSGDSYHFYGQPRSYGVSLGYYF